MDVPQFIVGDEVTQDNYQEELNQTISQNLSNNGFIIPSLTNANLTTDLIPDGNGGTTTLAAFMPDGTFWYVTDAVPPCYVGKISGALVKFTTTAYP